MPRVIHFEIHADDPQRAVKFYRDVFGWQINKADFVDYWLAETGSADQPGINGAIMPRLDQGTTYNTVDVPSLEEFMRKIDRGCWRPGHHAQTGDSWRRLLRLLQR